MERTEVNKTINTSAESVWGVINQFTGVEKFVPAIENSVGKGEGEGMERQCTLSNGASFDETLLKLDHQNMELQYDVHDPSPFPFSNYMATMKVTPIDSSKCEVSWNCTYQVDSGTVDESNRMLSDIFTSGIESLEKLNY
ncbi:MAG: SRPBCC family protein [Cyclobacteriaceae bacterium]|nr:SRPBCC family protein [Cyclobacteriaceae bacterium]